MKFINKFVHIREIEMLTAKRIYSSGSLDFFQHISRAFSKLNFKGVITILFVFVIFSAALGYFAALYFIFDTGFLIQQNSLRETDLKEVVYNLELELHEKQIQIVKENKSLLDSMEKISDIRYIIPRSLTVLGSK